MTSRVPRRRFDIVIVGSGPVGATFARVIKDAVPAAAVLLVESGPLIARPPGRHVQTIADADRRRRAQVASQGPSQAEEPVYVAADFARALAAGRPLPVRARPGTWLLADAAAQPAVDGMPAAAMSCNVGGMGAHWTCICPTPGYAERVSAIPPAHLDLAFGEAARLLRVVRPTWTESSLGERIRRALAGAWDSGRTRSRRIQPLPMATTLRRDGTQAPNGPATILGRLTRGPSLKFELRANTVARKIDFDGRRAHAVELYDLANSESYRIDADVVVAACDALRTPQFLWASGIRPPALGRFLNDHHLIVGTIAPDDSLGRHARRATPHSDAMGLSSDGVWLPYHPELFPFHGQIVDVRSSPVSGDPARADAMVPPALECMLFAPKDIRSDDRVEFDGAQCDAYGLPSMRIQYGLTPADHSAISDAVDVVQRLTEELGSAADELPPFVFPAGSSLHYQGTARMGARDDGSSVCDPSSRVWNTTNVYVGGNAVIPTVTACNPTLTSVAHAVYAARRIAASIGT